jgi:hypothetical protein
MIQQYGRALAGASAARIPELVQRMGSSGGGKEEKLEAFLRAVQKVCVCFGRPPTPMARKPASCTSIRFASPGGIKLASDSSGRIRLASASPASGSPIQASFGSPAADVVKWGLLSPPVAEVVTTTAGAVQPLALADQRPTRPFWRSRRAPNNRTWPVGSFFFPLEPIFLL